MLKEIWQVGTTFWVPSSSLTVCLLYNTEESGSRVKERPYFIWQTHQMLVKEFFDSLWFPLHCCIVQICLFFIVALIITSLSHANIIRLCLTTLDPCGLSSPNVLSFALLFWSCLVFCYIAHHLVDLDDAALPYSREELEDTLSIISHCNTCSSSAGNYLQEL